MMDITKDLLEPLGLVAVRANTDWIVIRRKGYFDTFLEGEPFTSVEVLWNRAQDTVLARVWGKTMHKTGNANLAKICKRVFSRRPCFGIWKQDIGSDFIERLRPCDFPVLRFKSLSCVDWVDDANVSLPETVTDPATCTRCLEDATREAAAVTEDPTFFVETELEPLSTRGVQPIPGNVSHQIGEKIKTENADVKSEGEENEDFEIQDEEEGSGDEHYYDDDDDDEEEEDIDDEDDQETRDERTDDQKDYIDHDDDEDHERKHSTDDFETYDLRIKSVFVKENPNRKKPKWQTDKGDNMFEMKNWMPFFFPNGKKPICPFCGSVKADQNIVRKHVKVCCMYVDRGTNFLCCRLCDPAPAHFLTPRRDARDSCTPLDKNLLTSHCCYRNVTHFPGTNAPFANITRIFPITSWNTWRRITRTIR